MRAHLDIRHEGTLGDDSRIRMQIDSESTAFLMSILTDLYSDPELAVIREYSTNAFDSHRAAGNTDPIEVELPSSLRPLFVVRDRGVGLSVSDIVENFSKYGWSSKRDTDAEVGMLGLGCKSGLTYTSQFTLIATKDGVRATVLVTREVDGAGAVQIIDTASTDDPNGVEIRIPVHYVPEFNRKAVEFYSFWERGSVLVNGEQPAHLFDNEDALLLDPDVALVPHLLDEDYIVMGNVAYPTGRKMVRGGRWSVVAWVPIGAVDFTPSREALQMTKRTKDALETVEEFVFSRMVAKAQEDIDASPDHWEALKRTHRWREVVYSYRAWTYQGEPVPVMPIPMPHSSLKWRGPALSTASTRPGTFDFSSIESGVFLVGHSGVSLSRPDKERLVKYLQSQGISTYTSVFAMMELPAAKWISAKARIVDLDDLRSEYDAEKRVSQAGKNIHGLYRILTRTGDIATTGKLKDHIVWFPADVRHGRSAVMGFIGMCDDVSVVLVSRIQQAKFLKENPTAISHKEFIEALVYVHLSKLTFKDVAHLTLRDEIERTNIRGLYKYRTQLHDPELVDLVELAGDYWASGMNDIWRALRDACEHPSVQVVLPTLEQDASLVRRLRAIPKRYPLLSFVGRFGGYGGSRVEEKEFVRYINLVHYSES
jgi:hypothetical protein